jgi:glycine dehydrogenase subunit 1
MTAATIYMTLIGPQGLSKVAAVSMQRSGELVEALTQVKGVRAAFNGSRFHEAVLLLDRPASAVLRELETQGILGGFDLSGDYPELGSALLVCATETKTAGDIARYAAALGAAVQKVRAA